jgi:hypothetical protein
MANLLGALIYDVPYELEPGVQKVVVHRNSVLELIIHSDPGFLTKVSAVTNIERTDVLARHEIAIELVVAPVDLVLTRETKAGKNGTARGVRSRAEGWGEFRL